jgi:multidrug efflux pump subunit AcrB
MVSMFGFIVALGIVVDDAIIVGENIYLHRQQGDSFARAAVRGAREVAVPLSFAIMTNIVAFLPLLLLPGQLRLMFGAIPLVVILCFVVSWVEALFIMPAHLAQLKPRATSRLGQAMDRLQIRFDRRLTRFIENLYRPALERCMNWPAMTVATALLVLTALLGYAIGGHMGFKLMPQMEGRWAKASMELPEDLSMKEALVIRDQLQDLAGEMAERHGIESAIVGMRSEIMDEILEVGLLLAPSEDREVSSREIVKLWRLQAARELKHLNTLRFGSGRKRRGGLADPALTLELRHADATVLQSATDFVARQLHNMAPVSAVFNTMTNGKAQWKLQLNEQGRSLGLDAANLAAQLRSSLYGAKALRQQNGENEVTVLVRLPEQERQTAKDIEQLLVQTSRGGYLPLAEVAFIERALAPGRIIRSDGQRIERISAEVEQDELVPTVLDHVNQELIPQLQLQFPELQIGHRGNQAKIRESLFRLKIGVVYALSGIYILLAIVFRSYLQPLLVLAVIPFGAAGAILGHILLGHGLSVVSLMGMLALSGVVVNDSLIIVDYANRLRRQGMSVKEAAQQAAQRRFRPILLTTLTTFGGVAPMVFETSRQAQFIVPMAVSLGFGILLTTVVGLLLLPTLYLVAEQHLENRAVLRHDSVVLD